jgi:two-component system LytT family response regulator
VIDFAGDDIGSRRLVVAEGHHIVRLIPLDVIIWVSTKNEAVRLYLSTGEIETDASLSALTQTLGGSFLRVNRQALVNLTAISEVHRRRRHGEGEIVLRNGHRVPVTRRYAPLLRDWLLGAAATSRGSRPTDPAEVISLHENAGRVSRGG